MRHPILTGLLGLSVADAIGVPVEFNAREALDANPVTDIRGYGTYNQPPGYFSDDSSLAFGLAESLAKGSFDLSDQARRLVNYKLHGYWTPDNRIFDIGRTTSDSIDRLSYLLENQWEDRLSTLYELATVQDNGNGALMRIFPLYAFLRYQPKPCWYDYIRQHSALTHGHQRSAWCCLLYLRLCHRIIGGEDLSDALTNARRDVLDRMAGKPPKEEYDALHRLLSADFATLPRAQVRGNGYVVFSLEAALWSLLNSSDYRSAVLGAVNLGEDTDTTACITGAPAALFYGVDSIPDNWRAALARRADVEDLGRRLENTTFPG